MADREKVIKGLECCIANRHNNCPYKSTDKGIDKVTSCTTYLMKDAIALLKEQETGVSPKEIKMYPNNVWACGNCGHVAVGSAAYKAKYCPECGKKVQWGG